MGIKAIFIGNLTKDAEVVELPTNHFIKFRVAVNERSKQGETAQFLDVTGDYNVYKNMLPYLLKGRMVFVAGREVCSLYQTKDNQYGIDRKVFADSIDFVGGGHRRTSSEDYKMAAPDEFKSPTNEPIICSPTEGAQKTIIEDMPF